MISNHRMDAFLEAGNFEITVCKLFEDQYSNHDDKRTEPFWKLWEVARPRACFFPASTRYHGVWVGGLNDHMNDILVYMWYMKNFYDPNLTAVEIAVLALLHDWEKLWKYQLKPIKSVDGSTVYYRVEEWAYSKERPTVSHNLRIGAFLYRSWLRVDDRILNALTMSEGGWSVESRAGNHTESLPVAALLHAADMFSAKVRGRIPSDWAEDQWKLLEKTHPGYAGLLQAQTEVETASPIEKVLWPD